MKTSRLLPFVAAVVFASGLLTAPARADDAPDAAKRRAAAEEFLQARKMEDLVNHTATQMAEATDRISEGIAQQAAATVNKPELIQKMRAEARSMIGKELNWETVRPAFVDAYSQAFTEAELKEMTAFYKSTAGQKLVTVDPEVLGKMEKTSRERAMTVMPKLVQRLREIVAAANPPGSAPPMVAPPMPPGLKVPPSPPPGMLPPAAPPTMSPPNVIPPTVTPPPGAAPTAPAPNGTPAVRSPGNP